MKIDDYWKDIPVGEKQAITYDELCELWKKDKRVVRSILHELSIWDNGDNYILIRSGSGKGFYKTDDEEIIKAYKNECLSKGRSNFAPVKKINRILRKNGDPQYSMINNLRLIRLERGLSQPEVCKQMNGGIDVPLLSRMENGVCLPTPGQLLKLARIYGVEPSELLAMELFGEIVCESI